MNILSIDFDYFQNVSKQQLQTYPDGIDLNTEMSETVWSSHYADDRNNLFNIGINIQELDMLKELLLKQSRQASIMIANSHSKIYNFVHTLVTDRDALSIVNVDMHHDFFNNNPNLDCGNWVGFLMNERQSTGKGMNFKWIANPVGLDAYGFKKSETQNIIETSLSCICEKSFDAVFLCRSDTWTPPHLDKYFTELCDVMLCHFDSVCVEQNINKPRRRYLEIIKMTNRIKQDMLIRNT